MNGKTFRTQVALVTLFLSMLSGAALWASVWGTQDTSLQLALRAVPTALIPIGAAWLAYCWQRRIAFTKALFDVWQKTVITLQDARQYTRLTEPTDEDHRKVLHSVSCRIDDIRGAFRNVGEHVGKIADEDKTFILSVRESKSIGDYASILQKYNPDQIRIGAYPFESLKQIHRVIERLGCGQDFTPQNAEIARNVIDALWKILRNEMLKELDRDFPAHPDTPYIG